MATNSEDEVWRLRRRKAWGAEKKGISDVGGVVGKAQRRDGDGNTGVILRRKASWPRTRYGRRSTSQPAPGLAEGQVKPRAMQEL
jgi:hypothetical protein